MKTIQLTITSIVLVFAIQSMAIAQSATISETFKEHFNETVQLVHQTDDADEKRAILNESFDKMMDTLDQIDERITLSDSERAQIQSFRNALSEKQHQLNGTDGFDPIADAEINDFTDYSQDSMEQASHTVTIGITTLVLIIILLILLF